MKKYEGIFIIDPRLTEDERKSEIVWIQDTIKQHDGACLDMDEWGRKRLAYDIKKMQEGYYVLLRFHMAPEELKKIQKVFQLREQVLRSFIVVFKEIAVPVKKEEQASVPSQDPSEQVAATS